MEVRVHQARISTRDLGLRVDRAHETGEASPPFLRRLDFSLNLTHQLGSLDKFLLVLITKLCELVNVLRWSDLKRHLDREWRATSALEHITFIHHDTVAD